ncbi:MAG TPA: hypothetical protein V6C65_01105 [Allocoleopsis sp.]
MAFVRERSVHNIKFGPDHKFAGLEMKTKSASVAYFANLAKLLTKIGQLSKDTGGHVEADQEGMAVLDLMVTLFQEVLAEFSTKLVSWNYQEEDDNGEIIDIPPTLEGLKEIDDAFMMELIGEWMEHIGGVNTDLKDNSTSGGISQGLSIPMEALSSNQQS